MQVGELSRHVCSTHTMHCQTVDDSRVPDTESKIHQFSVSLAVFTTIDQASSSRGPVYLHTATAAAVSKCSSSVLRYPAAGLTCRPVIVMSCPVRCQCACHSRRQGTCCQVRWQCQATAAAGAVLPTTQQSVLHACMDHKHMLEHFYCAGVRSDLALGLQCRPQLPRRSPPVLQASASSSAGAVPEPEEHHHKHRRRCAKASGGGCLAEPHHLPAGVT